MQPSAGLPGQQDPGERDQGVGPGVRGPHHILAPGGVDAGLIQVPQMHDRAAEGLTFAVQFGEELFQPGGAVRCGGQFSAPRRPVAGVVQPYGAAAVAARGHQFREGVPHSPVVRQDQPVLRLARAGSLGRHPGGRHPGGRHPGAVGPDGFREPGVDGAAGDGPRGLLHVGRAESPHAAQRRPVLGVQREITHQRVPVVAAHRAVHPQGAVAHGGNAHLVERQR